MLYHVIQGYTDAIYVALYHRVPGDPRPDPFPEHRQPPDRVPIEAQAATLFEALFRMASWLIRAAAAVLARLHRSNRGDRQRPSVARAPLVLAAGALAGCLAVFCRDAGATILTFDQGRSATQVDVVPIQAGAPVAQDYGDRVTGSPMTVSGGAYTYGNDGEGFTPNVGVNYLATNGVFLWTVEYGDLTNVIFAGAGSNTFTVHLEADPGFEVLLYGFDLAGWPLTDYIIDAVTIDSESTTLFSLTDVLVEGDAAGSGHTAFNFSTPLIGAELLIGIDFSNVPAGQQDNFGLDNIRFGQIPPPEIAPTEVPEPASMALFAASLALLGLVRRRF